MIEEPSETLAEKRGIPTSGLQTKTPQCLSPDANGANSEDSNEMTTPPPRVLSSHSLVGEDLLTSSRRPLYELVFDTELSPFTPTDSPDAIPHPICLLAKTKDTTTLPGKDSVDQLDPAALSVASSQKARRTRPPRVPQQQLSLPLNAGRKDPRHRRVNSDISNLSALTDISWDSHVNPLKKMRRTLSLDGNERSPGNRTAASSPKSTPLTLLQPILGNEPPSSIFASSISKATTNNERSLSSHRVPQKKHIDSLQMQNQDEAPGNVQSLSRNAFVGFARKSSTPASLSLSDVLAAYPREAEDETALLGVLEEKKLRKRLLRSIILPNIEDMNGDMANANAFGGPENLVLQILSNLLRTFSAFESASVPLAKFKKELWGSIDSDEGATKGAKNQSTHSHFLPTKGHSNPIVCNENENHQSIIFVLGLLIFPLAYLSAHVSVFDASVSRHLITFGVTRFTEQCISPLFLNANSFSMMFGPVTTRVLLHSKGWPSELGIWVCIDITLFMLFPDNLGSTPGKFHSCILWIVVLTVMNREIMGNVVLEFVVERYKRRIHEKLRTINLLNKVYRFVCGSESRKDSCFVSRSSNCPQVDEMMHFRSSASLLYDYLWLPTSTMVLHSRESCFKQAQDVYEGLAKSSNGELEFNHVCAIASGQKDVDPDIAKDLEIFLSPNRTGKLSKISFLKSIDSLYKSTNVLTASIEKTLLSLETFFLVTCRVTNLFLILGIANHYDETLNFSVTCTLGVAIVLIVLASLDQLRGSLFILKRRPFDIGDRIRVSGPFVPTTLHSAGWIVEKFDLFTTSLRSGSTFELVSFPNSMLVNSAIANLGHSTIPKVAIRIKFCSSASEQEIASFHCKLEGFIRDRPKEWVQTTSFRCVEINADLDYIEFSLTLQHTLSWQNLAAILESKAFVVAYATQLQIEMGIRQGEGILRRKHYNM